LFHNEPLPPQLYSLSQSGTLSNSTDSDANGPDNLLEQLQQLHIEPDIERLERRLLDDALNKAEGNLAAAARLLGLTR
ncbi:helix-turn-helix domain-containing protein, partial [Mycobacterium tuberculosis]